MSTLYLMFPHLMPEQNFLIIKVMNLWRKEGKSQIMIYLIRCMLRFQNIKYTRLLLFSLKTSLGKEKTSVWHKTNLNERLLTSLKEKAPLYVDVAGLTKSQQNKNEDTSLNYFSKTEYWRPLVPNPESVN